MIFSNQLDPNFYRPAIVSTNVATKTIEEAKIIILSGAHTDEKDREFNVKIVKALYQPEYRLLVEDSYLKSKENLDKRQIVGLNPNDFRIDGWDDPEACNNFDAVAKVLSAIAEVKKTWDMKSESYTLVQNFALRYPTTKFFDTEHFLLFCELRAKQWREEHILATFEARQKLLSKRLLSITDKMMVFVGTNHVDPKNPIFKPWALSFISSLDSIPYMILNPAKTP